MLLPFELFIFYLFFGSWFTLMILYYRQEHKKLLKINCDLNSKFESLSHLLFTYINANANSIALPAAKSKKHERVYMNNRTAKAFYDLVNNLVILSNIKEYAGHNTAQLLRSKEAISMVAKFFAEHPMDKESIAKKKRSLEVKIRLHPNFGGFTARRTVKIKVV